jgi:hypothetical protein
LMEGNPKHSKKTRQCHCLNHGSYKTSPEIIHGAPWWQPANIDFRKQGLRFSHRWL